ncbi:hypothetical protein Ancab_021938 [Ancistrocladus abbreviatus]
MVSSSLKTVSCNASTVRSVGASVAASLPTSVDDQPHYARDKAIEETIICDSKPASLSSIESSDVRSWMMTTLMREFFQGNAYSDMHCGFVWCFDEEN